MLRLYIEVGDLVDVSVRIGRKPERTEYVETTAYSQAEQAGEYPQDRAEMDHRTPSRVGFGS